MRYRLKIKNITLALIILCFVSCSQDEELSISNLQGVYIGTFTVEYYEDPIFYDEMELSNAVTIEFENGNYSCSSGDNHIPAGRSGNFEIKGNKIIFIDENGWYADFDGNLVLDGEYDIKAANSEIIISAHKGIGFYRYQLKKQ